VTRLGGDEFVVVAEEVTDGHRAAEIAKRLLAACEAPTLFGGAELQVTPSIGVVLSADVADPGALLRCADAAMYRAKEHGGARYEVHDTSATTGPSVMAAGV
jgi:diguanylate cyclase (GGDEF)-like protein